MLLLTPLSRALAELEDFLAQPKNKYLIAGTIQCFEFSFELSWKAMQRILKEQGVETGSPMQVFRAAHKIALIDSFELWAGFLKQRNLSVHTYNQDVAEEVYKAAQSFAIEARILFARLEKANS
ncbi:MAG: HI0074 family nucleotidyltransferase substrate-binding subunit [Proteobacteria bacterium]|nr:HI0074 family nucleotidyltransferase substrate-binding subunit [Pseudomonadota bacterium]